MRTQTYRNLDIILVDDGSVDAGGAICDLYAAKDHRIRVIHQENRGLAAARNAGLRAAEGAFIQFADSDDALRPELTASLLRLIRQTGADIAACDYEEIFPGETAAGKTPGRCHYTVYEGRKKYTLLFGRPHGRTVVQCGKMFRREVFSGICFAEGKYHEDEFIILDELAAADRLAFTDRKLYMYYRNPGGITGTVSCRRAQDACEARMRQIAGFLETGHTDLAAAAYYCFLFYFRDWVRRLEKHGDNKIPEMEVLFARCRAKYSIFDEGLFLRGRLTALWDITANLLYRLRTAPRRGK